MFSLKMGKHEEPKDKQISSHRISFTAIYIFMENFFYHVSWWLYRIMKYLAILTPT